MFTDTVTSALIEKDKTKRVIQEEWSKRRSKSFESLNYQQGSNRENNIIIKQNKEMKDDNVRPRNRRKRTQDVKGTSKADNGQLKTSKNVKS